MNIHSLVTQRFEFNSLDDLGQLIDTMEGPDYQTSNYQTPRLPNVQLLLHQNVSEMSSLHSYLCMYDICMWSLSISSPRIPGQRWPCKRTVWMSVTRWPGRPQQDSGLGPTSSRTSTSHYIHHFSVRTPLSQLSAAPSLGRPCPPLSMEARPVWRTPNEVSHIVCTVSWRHAWAVFAALAHWAACFRLADIITPMSLYSSVVSRTWPPRIYYWYPGFA